MKALSATIVIHVSDLNRAISYYTAVLGFKIDFEFGEYVGLTYDDVSIHVSGPTYAGQKKAAGNAHFYIYCDDLDAYYDLISEKGAIITVPIGNRQYGMRDFTVDDADGNTVVFGMESV